MDLNRQEVVAGFILLPLVLLESEIVDIAHLSLSKGLKYNPEFWHCIILRRDILTIGIFE